MLAPTQLATLRTRDSRARWFDHQGKTSITLCDNLDDASALPLRRKLVIETHPNVHSMVDDRSRLAYSEILPNEKGATCTGFIARAADYFAAHGTLAIERVMTGNHWSYRRSADFAAVIATLGAKHKFIKPHCPWQNGKVERFNRTLQAEWAYRDVFTSNTERGLPPISLL